MRGYAPTAVPADGAYHLGALVADAVALHEVLGGDGDAVLIGHDWGAEAAYGAAALAPDRWRRLVTLAVPPAALDEVLFSDYEQLKRSFYLFMFGDPAGLAETAVARDDLAFLDKLWRDWSPGSSPVSIWPGSRTACGSQPTWPPRSATTGRRSTRKRPPVRPPSPRCTCTEPATAASAWTWSAVPNACWPLRHA